MPGRFTSLASGSSGNSSLLEWEEGALLIDCGLPTRTISERLANIGKSWNAIQSVLLTHTHSDHWTLHSAAQLRAAKITLYAHRDHFPLLASSPGWEPLRKAGLIREFEESRSFQLSPGLIVTPVHVPHDADPTFAFRIDRRQAGGAGWSLGFLTDCGATHSGHVAAFRGVDLLALEFNHDVALEHSSGRPARLVHRVLGREGHLSNEQAAAFMRQLIEVAPGPETLIQLHLSRDCNTIALARDAAAAIFSGKLITATQFQCTPPAILNDRPHDDRRLPQFPAPRLLQRALPGLELG